MKLKLGEVFMLIEIFLGIIAGSFLILAVYLIVIGSTLNKTLKDTDELIRDFRHKSKAIDPLFHLAQWVNEGVKIVKNLKDR